MAGLPKRAMAGLPSSAIKCVSEGFFIRAKPRHGK